MLWLGLIFAACVMLLLTFLWRQAHWQANVARQYTEDARREQQAVYAQFEVRQQALFNGMIEGVLLLDQQGRVQMVNESLRKSFDVAKDIRGQTIMEAFHWPELAKLAARLQSEKNISDAELEIHRPFRRFLQINAAIVHDHADLEQGQLFVFHDVTRLKELEDFRKEFVANVSHELRTPLSLIKGYAQTLLDGAKDDPAQSLRFLQKIDKHSDRLHFLMEDLLAISHLESGQATLNSKPVNLHELAQRVLDDLVAPASARATTLENKIPPQTAIWADADRLQQVLFNLTENAIKYGRSGGCVTVGTSSDTSEKVEIFVADDGPGIPPEALGRVFERFYRVDRARSRESGGTGLGLAIVKHIVQAHGGEAWVKSELQKGASFFFTLPRKPNQQSSNGAPADQLQLSHSHS
jgi:two-component system, OmpR family, phosphate regulon sensor histidine kinase PhoR